MTWFEYLTTGAQNFSPVRRRLIFPVISEKIKVGDWIHVNLDTLDIGKFFYLQDGLMKSSFDHDSYVVVYQTEDSKTPTFNFISNSESDSFHKKNLWFKSLSAVEPGSKPSGNYYIYYHKDNIQYLSLQGSSYTSTVNPSGHNYIASSTQNSSSSINYYSLEVLAKQNERVSALSFFGDKEIWSDGEAKSVGAKAIGPFTGPRLKIHAEKNNSSGFISLKIVKTSATGSGQKIVKDKVEIDLYSPQTLGNQLIYEIDMEQELLFSTYDELYGDFYFEIEILQSKNQSSSAFGCKIEKYAFSKNYQIQFDKEEIKLDIAFKSTGGVK